jgi:hypothetical protein
MAKKIILNEEDLRQQMTGAIPVFVPPPPVAIAQEQPMPPAQTNPALEPLPPSPAVQGPQAQPAQEKTEEALLAEDTSLPAAAVEDKDLSLVLERAESKALSAKARRDGEDKDLQRYEKMFLHRSLAGLPRTNVGISIETLDKVERVVHRLFEGQIAVSAFIDNVISEHLAKHKEAYNKWLMEKSQAIF